MISKKRYYGLALPFWVCSDCDAWEVIGSKEELRDRAVAGWEVFDGHSPHRPWVDAVEIACTSCGGQSQRIRDVGNPWLDAGIVGLSTLGWNSDRAYWEQWYPADWVSESFPGQFRNWFYALLTMSTVMTGHAPMRTLFGYALMRDEHGEEMHKSKGNSIPFDEAAEEIGADVMRWMFAAANPAVNLNFGYGPGHEVVRRFFLPLWNTYGFFVTYARLDGWLPGSDEAASRTLLDRWILSRLDRLVTDVRAAFDAYDAMRGSRAMESFVDDLSNWYVRRNRRRFWKGELDADKRAAYATLHEVLVTFAQLLAPTVPHLADELWENLVVAVDASAENSVHLTDFPRVVAGRRDAVVDDAVALARRIVTAGRAARAASGVRTRQPLRAVRVKLPPAAQGRISADPGTAAELTEGILEELNVKALELIPDESELVERSLYPLLPVIGPRHGAAVGAVMAAVRKGEWSLNADGTASVGGVTLQADEFELTARGRSGQEVGEDGDLLVALDTTLDPELEAEGLAREVAHRLQALRRSAGYEISDRVRVAISGDAATLERFERHAEWLADELLATELTIAADATVGAADGAEDVDLDGVRLRLEVGRV